MKRCLIILFGIQVFLFQSCKEDDSATPNPYAAKILSQLNSSDTFLYDFPLEKGKLDTAAFEYMCWQEKELKLISLQKGFDSIQIRIWYGCALSGDRLVTLVHNRKSWKAELSNLIGHGGGEEGSAKYLYSLTRDIEYKIPQSGWIKFIDSLFDLKILTLPNDYEIPNFKPVYPMDGCGIGFEISTKNVYRFYKYSNPGFSIDEQDHWQVKNVLRIIKLLSTEFNITEWPERKLRDPNKADQKNKEGKIRVTEMNLDSNSTKNQ